MEIINLKGTDKAPSVKLDKEKGIFEISGRSLMENAVAFYDPVLTWVVQYAKEANPSTDFIFKVEYISTDSSKVFLDILLVLQKIKGTTIHWYFRDGDMEAGEELSELVTIPFEFKNY